MTAKNPSFTQAARDRAKEAVASYVERIAQANDTHARALTLGDRAAGANHDVLTLTAERLGYEKALADLLPKRTVDAIVGGADDAEDEDDASN